jgi:hypothetical protein
MVVMVGPKMQELKVTDPEKFAFKPKELLAEITQIYINLGDSPEFIRAVADDGRSYSKATFERLVRVLKNRAIMLDNEIKQVLAFLGKVEEAKATIEIEDEREIPDEFLGESGWRLGPAGWGCHVKRYTDAYDARRPAYGYAHEEPGDLACLEGDGRPVHDPGGLAVEQQGPVQQRSVSLPFSWSRTEHDEGN